MLRFESLSSFAYSIFFSLPFGADVIWANQRRLVVGGAVSMAVSLVEVVGRTEGILL